MKPEHRLMCRQKYLLPRGDKVIEALNIDMTFLDYYRHPTKYKKLIFQAYINGAWYDLSNYVLAFRVNNRIEVLRNPAIDSATIVVRNENNAFTPTQYNDIFDPTVGKISGTVDDDFLNKVWEVKILVEADNGTSTIQIPLFHGWKPQEAITEHHKTADIELKDLLWIATQKKPDNPLLYASYTPDAILNDILVNRLGIDATYLDLQALTTPFDIYIADNHKTWWQILQDIVQATGGKLTCSPNGRIIFRTRIENFTAPSSVLTITENEIQNYELDKKREYNQIKIESEGYSIGDTQEYVIDHELEGDARIIKAGTQATFELEYLCDYIKDPDTTVYLSYEYGSSPIATDTPFSAGQDDENIRLDELTAYPDKLVLKITNLATSTDYEITHVKFKAIAIKKKETISVEKPNQTGQPDSELSLTSFYSSEALLSNIADVIYDETTKTIKFELQLSEFYPDIYAGNLVDLTLAPKGIASGTFIVERVEHNISETKYRTKITIREWRDITFDTGDKIISKPIESDYIQQPPTDSKVEEIETRVNDIDNRTDYIDGQAPAVPTGLSLSTILENGASFVKASWTANTETDLLGYELAWSYDGVHWDYITTSDTLVKFEVAGNKKEKNQTGQQRRV